MKDNSFVKGESADKKFDSIERVLARFSRRLHKSIICAVPPSVISNYCAELPDDGIILRCIFPCPGKVKGVTLHYTPINNDEKPTIDIVFTDGKKTDAATVKAFNPEINDVLVNNGTLMALKLNGQVENIWVSALFIPTINASEKESLSIDQLDSVAKEVLEEA